ncbi:MAG: aldo/keto reductase [Chloroflexi bacterium]|nr:aldo/keto reductase [Chloroflexota bacterium]
MDVDSTYTLSNGVKIPCIGFGTWQIASGQATVDAVKEALRAGYRHIDTASIYGNEESVGRAIRQSCINPQEIFVTTKLWNSDHGYEETLKAFELSRRKLGLDIIDLYLIHWPNPKALRPDYAKHNAQSWRAMEELYESGQVRAIGVSNFLSHHLDALCKTARIEPMVNQIPIHPGCAQETLVTHCQKRDILAEAYSPLGTGKLITNNKIQAIAQKYHKGSAQICLRWSLQMGFLPLPKSITPKYIQENVNIFDFELDTDDIDALSALKEDVPAVMDPDRVPF